jgi:hypothetical protein
MMAPKADAVYYFLKDPQQGQTGDDDGTEGRRDVLFFERSAAGSTG